LRVHFVDGFGFGWGGEGIVVGGKVGNDGKTLFNFFLKEWWRKGSVVV